MVVSANCFFIVISWFICGICKFCTCPIYLLIILMKKIKAFLRETSKQVSFFVVKIQLIMFYILVILPYHVIMRKNYRTWVDNKKEESSNDFQSM